MNDKTDRLIFRPTPVVQQKKNTTVSMKPTPVILGSRKSNDGSSVVKKNVDEEKNKNNRSYTIQVAKKETRKNPVVRHAGALYIASQKDSSISIPVDFSDNDLLAIDSKLDVRDINDIRKIIHDIDVNNDKELLNFGISVQRSVRDMSSRMLEFSKQKDERINVTPYLKKIYDTINTVSPEDLLGNNGITGKIRTFMSGLSPRDNLALVSHDLDDAIMQIESRMPTLIEYVGRINNMEDDMKTIRNNVRLYDVAATYIIRSLQSITNDGFDPRSRNINNQGTKRDYKISHIISILSERINSLKVIQMGKELDGHQIELLRMTYMEKIKLSRDIVIDLVSKWKSQCATAIQMNEDGMTNSSASYAADVIRLKNMICEKIGNELN